MKPAGKLRRVAVVGCGEAGYDIHLPALALMKEREVVGACDSDDARRESVAKKYGTPVFESVGEMLDRVKPDVLIVATPPDSHESVCLEGIGAGCHIICEKPFVGTLDAGQRIISAAEESNVGIALNHEFREMPIFRSVVDAATREEKAPVFFAQLWQNANLPPGAEGGWRGSMERRTLHEAGIHMVDFALALFGEMPVYASSTMTGGGVAEGGNDGLVTVTLEFPNGRLAQLVQNRMCKGETHYFEVRADTTSASYRASFGGRARVTTGLYRSTLPHLRFDYGASGVSWIERGSKRTLLARNPPNPRVAATRIVLEQSLRAFETGSAPPTTARNALDTLRVIDACYASASSGSRVAIALRSR
jgi:predicted dehydrogenase